MELKQIEKLMSAMGPKGIKRIVIKKKDFELELERESENYVQIVEPSAEQVEQRLANIHHNPHTRADIAFSKGSHTSLVPQPSEKAAASVSTQEKNEDHGKPIKSPMVGTFYEAPSPDSDPFVKVGDSVQEDTVVCIIEAMKVMNEVKAGVSGIVSEILVDNSHPVEFGTVLFKVK